MKLSNVNSNDDIVAFIEARLAEDEEIALACISINDRVNLLRGVTPPRWHASENSSDITDEAGILRVRHTWKREGEHIARHDPARVLREIEADRALLAKLRQVEEFGEQLRVDTEILILRQVIAIRAAIWNDHPDYEGWLQ